MIKDLGNEIILENDFITLHLLPFGATIYKLYTKDKFGEKENIVLSHKNIDTYKTNPSYFGTTCGRHAGRIENGKFEINGQEYLATQNDGNNSLHGGQFGVSFKDWDYTYSEDDDTMVVKFTLFSKDGEDGFPGNVQITTQYTVIKNKLYLEYVCDTDKDTLINLTNHSYFNLYGKNKKPIYNHELYLSCNKYVATNEESLPTTIEDVKNTPFDFNTAKKIGNIEEIDFPLIRMLDGYDTCFIFKDDALKGLSLFLEETGRFVEILTTNPSVVLYTFNKDYNIELDEGTGEKHGGIAIEPQYVPNAINRTDSKYFICSPTQKYKESTIYTFGVR